MTKRQIEGIIILVVVLVGMYVFINGMSRLTADTKALINDRNTMYEDMLDEINPASSGN
jgi:hypothetical protein